MEIYTVPADHIADALVCWCDPIVLQRPGLIQVHHNDPVGLRWKLVPISLAGVRAKVAD